MLDTANGQVTEQMAEQAWMRVALHDLCQPLTALECRLHLGTMDHNGRAPTAEEMLDTIHESLAECERMMRRVRAMQEKLYEDDGSQAQL